MMLMPFLVRFDDNMDIFACVSKRYALKICSLPYRTHGVGGFIGNFLTGKPSLA